MKTLSKLIKNTSLEIERQCLRGLPGPVVIVDRDMNVIYANDAAAAVVGYTAQECIGRKCFDLFNADHCNTPSCALRRALMENRAITERTIARPRGQAIPIQYAGVPVRNKKGKVIGAVELVTDLTELYKVVGKVTEVTEKLTEASGQLAAAANQAGQASQQVANTSQDMARGANDQAGMLQTSAEAMKQLEQMVDQVARGAATQSNELTRASDAVQGVSAATDQVARSAMAVADSARKAADLAATGADKTRKTVEGMARVQLSFNDASEKVTDLGTRSEEIGKIVAVIDDIAAQTNLLALNAAIEAARAGEHGLGFAVVSDEVRKLAERTASATKEIADLVTSVQRGVSDAVKAMQEGGNQVKDGYGLANESGEALTQIQKAAVDVSEQIGQISSAAEEMSASATELVKVMDSVGSIVEQNTAAAQEMSGSAQEVGESVENAAGIAEESGAATEQLSASAQEMGAQVEQIVASSHSLNEMSRILKESVAQFKVNTNGAREKVAV